MNGSFELIDYLIFGLYAVTILSIGLWVSRDKKGKQKNAEDYFLASKSLPWWAVGASLIAANISAEQFIGMSGSGFALGLAIASYEWMAAITLLVVGKYFLPIFIEKGLYTIPEFIEKRFSTNLKTILAVFWIALFVFVNLTTVLFLGGKALDTIVGVGDGSIILNSINYEDTYSGDFTTRRAVIYTLSFTAKSYLFGPMNNSSVIKKSQADIGTDTDTPLTREERIVVIPNPTTADADDDFGFTTTISFFNDGKRFNPSSGRDT